MRGDEDNNLEILLYFVLKIRARAKSDRRNVTESIFSFLKLEISSPSRTIELGLNFES